MSKGDLMTDTEKATLERRIDELCQENERLHADQAHWELGNCPSCPNIADLQEALDENAKLRVERDEWKRVAESKQDSGISLILSRAALENTGYKDHTEYSGGCADQLLRGKLFTEEYRGQQYHYRWLHIITERCWT